MTQKYFFGECGGEDCPCRMPAVYHSAIVGYTCGKDKQDCNEQRCKNCPHGKTLEELAKVMAEAGYQEKRADNLYRLVPWQNLRRSKKNRFIEIELLKLKALLGGGYNGK